MPLYAYGCLECRARETRVAGLDDHTALCVDCGGIMLRVAEDIFQAYFTPVPGDLQAGEGRLKRIARFPGSRGSAGTRGT